MINFLKNKKWITCCTGIEINISAGQESDYKLCSITTKGDQLSILRKERTQGCQVPESLKSDGPCAITITGRGVLVKRSARIETLNPESLNELFPNLKAEEFYVQNFISGVHSYIAVMRKETAHAILKPFIDSGLDILALSLGPFPADHILTQLNCYGSEIEFDGHSVHLEDRVWSSYRYDPDIHAAFPLKLGLEPIDEQFVLAYATAFQLLMHSSLLTVEVKTTMLSTKLSEYVERRKFNFRSKALLGSFCLLLFINFLLFHFYDSENQALSGRLNINTQSRGTVEQLEKTASQKESLLKQLGWNRGVSYAYLCDQIGQTVPASAQLSRISINPERHGTSASDKGVVQETDKIHIEGLSSNLSDVNNWIIRLKDKSWVKDAVLSSYSPADEGSLNKLMVIISY